MPSPRGPRRVVGSLIGSIAALLVGLATALLIVAVAVVLLLNPIWIGIGQDHAEAGPKTRLRPRRPADGDERILFDLVVGPPDFDVQVLGQPVLNGDGSAATCATSGTCSSCFAALVLIAPDRLHRRASAAAGVPPCSGSACAAARGPWAS